MNDQDEPHARLEAPDLTAAGFAALKASARRDYAEGKVVVHDGWIVSQTEFDTLIAASADGRTLSPPRSRNS